MVTKRIKKYRKWILPALIYWGVSAVVLLSSHYALSQEADGTNCASGVIGLCTPGTFESSTSTIVETTQNDGTGTTTTTTTTTDTTTTTVTNPETGDLLTDTKVNEMGRNQRFGGDMTSDWGGQGSAKIRNGATCGDLGTDKCAELTGGGSFTSTLGQGGVGTTYKQIINMTHSSIDPSIDRGGQVAWSIRVEKRDASDSLHFRIAKTDGTTAVLVGNETLSAAGAAAITNTLFQGNFDFSGAITTKLTIEVSGRDINLAIGPLFDDVTVNVLYNVVNTIVTETITTIEQFVALGTFDQETIDVATDIFENNNVVATDTGLSIEPIEEPTSESSYESVSAEITEMVAPELQAPTIEVSVVEPQSVEIQVETQNVETEMQTEMNNDSTNDVAPTGGLASNEDSPQEGGGSVSSGEQDEKPEPAATAAEEPEPEEEAQSGPSTVEKKKEEPKEQPKKVAEKKVEKPKTKVEKKQEAKEKAASKIVKKMGDKGRYDDSNQLKTLVVMQVLGNTKTFFDNQTQLQDTPGFFNNRTVPDTAISDNNYSAYIMFGGSDAAHNALTDSQYR